MSILKCRICLEVVTPVPEKNQPPLGSFWCDGCGDYKLFCLSCLLMTNDSKHVCHFQTKLFQIKNIQIPLTSKGDML